MRNFSPTVSFILKKGFFFVFFFISFFVRVNGQSLHDGNVLSTVSMNVEVENVDDAPISYELLLKEPNRKIPKLRGGEWSLRRFFRRNIKYTPQAFKKKIEGVVVILATVNREGKMTEAYLLKRIGCGLDEEALRVVNMLPDFKPGTINGVPSEMKRSIIVKFKLPENYKFS